MSSLLSALTLAALAFGMCALQNGAAPGEKGAASAEKPELIYDFTVKDIEGDDVDLARYRGKVMLVVNVASR